MKKESTLQVRLLVPVCVSMFLATTLQGRQEQPPAGWQSANLAFRALNITSTRNSLWVCGTDETIAVSSDGGAHWEVKHQKVDGGLLLHIDFANSKFGYSAGTGGLILTTEDGGETWESRSGITETILQVSFSDPQHGLIRTPASLFFTVDGGSHWSTLPVEQNSEDMKEFPYTFSLAVLDSSHMAVMMKQGAAQYESQAFLYTQNSGKSWSFLKIPNVTLYSFLRVEDRYWAVGTEVIHKDQPGGGYGVPVALYSLDGEKWNHSIGDLSACKLEMCTVCTTRGCLSSNGIISGIFSDETSYSVFPAGKELTAKWASTDSTVCFVGNQVQCADLKAVTQAPASTGAPVPTVMAPGPLGAPTAQGPRCFICGLDTIFVDRRAQGVYSIKLRIGIATNGVVTDVEAQGAPTPEVKTGIERQVQHWIFEPYLTDGVPVNVKLNTSVRVNVIKPQ